MQLSDIYASIKSRAENDLSITQTDLTTWIDLGIQRINQQLKTAIPITNGQPTTYVPQFDPRYHEALILFAQAMYRESDADFNSSQYYLNQFNAMVDVMQRDMTIPPSLRVDEDVQQIIVTSATTLTYNLTMPDGSYYGDIVVYQNDVVVDDTTYTIDPYAKTLTFVTTPLVINDKITVEFQLDDNLINPPYQWWGHSGW